MAQKTKGGSRSGGKGRMLSGYRKPAQEPVPETAQESAFLLVPYVGKFHTMGRAYARYSLRHQSDVRVTVDVPAASADGIEAMRVYAVRPVKGGGL